MPASTSTTRTRQSRASRGAAKNTATAKPARRQRRASTGQDPATELQQLLQTSLDEGGQDGAQVTPITQARARRGRKPANQPVPEQPPAEQPATASGPTAKGEAISFPRYKGIATAEDGKATAECQHANSHITAEAGLACAAKMGRLAKLTNPTYANVEVPRFRAQVTNLANGDVFTDEDTAQYGHKTREQALTAVRSLAKRHGLTV